MSEALVPVITRVGLATLARLDGTGLQAQISHIAVGRGVNVAGNFIGYQPAKGATALYNEATRVPIISGSRLDPGGFRVMAEVPRTATPAEYAIREVGFFLSDGTLFALWSDPALVLAFKTTLADIALSLDLYLEQVPTDRLTLTVLDPEVPEYAGALASVLAAELYAWRNAMVVAHRLRAARI